MHASGDWARLGAVMGHEFGHHVAFRYGTQAELGAAPEGWPVSGEPPVERWADCVSNTFTGYGYASHGQAPCSGSSQTFANDWLAPGPGAHPAHRLTSSSAASVRDGFPDGFFDRVDPTSDGDFYAVPRLVTHIDDGAIAAVGDLYESLGLDGDVLDLMRSWVSHFRRPPRRLTVLGMNEAELDGQPDGR